jgi:Na+/proline symporter
MVFIVGIYTFSGGLTAVVMTDVVQMIIMFVGGAALVLLSIHAVGGDVESSVTQMPPKAMVTLSQSELVPEEDVVSALETEGFDVVSIRALDPETPGDDGEQRFIVRFEDYFSDMDMSVPDREAMWSQARLQVRDALALQFDSPEVSLRGFRNHLKILLPHTTTTAFPWTGIVFGLGIVMATAYMSGNQAVVQRTLGARSEWDAKGGMLFAGFLKSFIPLLVAVPGLCAVVLLPELERGDMAVPSLMRDLLPPGLRGLMFAAMFAGLMSSMDSALNSASTIWTTDLYGQAYRGIQGKEISERHSLFAGRSFTLGFVILAGALAEWIGDNEGLYNFLQTALSMFQGPVFAILLLGIMWKRATQWGGLAGLVLGVMFTTILNNVEGLFPSEDPFLFVSWWSFIFTLIVTVVVSLLTPPEPDEKIRGLVFGQVMKDGEIQRILQSRSDK